MSRAVSLTRDGVTLHGECDGERGPLVVLLHSGVGDRRSFAEVLPLLAGEARACSYDRRGYGESPLGDQPFSHAEDLLALLQQLSVQAGPEASDQVVLVGSSAGGAVCLDAALLDADRTAGRRAPRVGALVLIGTAVSGAPDLTLGEAEHWFDAVLDAAYDAGDLAEVNRLETWLWLDGPLAGEGRVGGAARELAMDMNRRILEHDGDEHEGSGPGQAWSRVEDITVPALVACGELDLDVLRTRSRALAERLPGGQHVSLPGRAHLPYLEDPAETAELVRTALTWLGSGEPGR